MRLIAVPLARVSKGATPVTTFLAQSTKAAARASSPAVPSTTSQQQDAAPGTVRPAIEKGKSPEKEPSSSDDQSKLPITTRVMNKAADIWVGLGREDQKSTFDWKKRTYNLGERLMDRIEYEEWALKGVDPAIGPSLKRSSERREEAKSSNTGKIVNELSKIPAENVPLLFPPSLLSSSVILSSLKSLTEARQPHHRQRLIWCVVGMPLTIPFILVPVVPNLPFFYLVWRAWSHWRALSSSRYLSELIKQGRLVPSPSEELDRILSLKAPSPAASAPKIAPAIPPAPNSDSISERDGDNSPASIDYEQYLLLKPYTIKELVKTFQLNHQLSVDLRRARQQTIDSIQRGQMGKLEQAAEAHSHKH